MSTPDHTGHSPPPFDTPVALDVSQSSGTPTVSTKKQAMTPDGMAMPVMVNDDGTSIVIDSSSTEESSPRKPTTRASSKQKDPSSGRRKQRESSTSSRGTSPQPTRRTSKKKDPEREKVEKNRDLPQPVGKAGPKGPSAASSSSVACGTTVEPWHFMAHASCFGFPVTCTY